MQFCDDTARSAVLRCTEDMYGGGKCPQLATHGSEQWLGLKLRKVCRRSQLP